MKNSTVSIKEQNKNMASLLFRRNVRKFTQNKLAVLGLVIIVIITGACIAGALLGLDYGTPVLTEMKMAPSKEHWFGTDTMGRDLFSRVLIGGGYSIFIGVFCSVMSAPLALYWEQWRDTSAEKQIKCLSGFLNCFRLFPRRY